MKNISTLWPQIRKLTVYLFQLFKGNVELHDIL